MFGRLRTRLVLVSAFVAALVSGTASAAQADETTGSIAGHFVTASQGVPDVQVIVYTPDFNAVDGGFARTDQSGYYQIDGLAPGDYLVEFTKYPDLDQWAFGHLSPFEADLIHVIAGQTTTVDDSTDGTTLPPPPVPGSISVTVTDKTTGQPIQHFCAEAFGDIAARACTDTGTAVMNDLPPGTYSVDVLDLPAQYFPPPSQNGVEVTSGQTTSVSFEAEAGGFVSTTVLDAATGAPLADVAVESWQVGSRAFGLSGGHRSDDQGRVTIGPLTAGDYRLYADPQDGTHGAQWVGPDGGTGSRDEARNVAVHVGETVSVPAIRLDRPGTVSGRVVDAATGRPVPDICAHPFAASTDAGPDFGPQCSDEQGRYTIGGLGPYLWPIEFSDVTGRYAWQWSGDTANQRVADPVRVHVGRTTTEDAHLLTAARITGHVLTPDGQPAADSMLFSVSAVTGDEAGPLTFVQADGQYTLKGLTGEKVKVLLETYPGLAMVWWQNAPTFAEATPIKVPWQGTVTGIDFVAPAA